MGWLGFLDSVPSANSPDDIPHVVGNQQRTRLVECHADWPAKGIAVSAEEAGQDIDGLAGRVAAVERYEDDLVAAVRSPVPRAMLANEHAFGEDFRQGSASGRCQAQRAVCGPRA